jgi:hypothetical protein
MRRPIHFALSAAAALLRSACVPPFSEMQSARTLGRERAQLTPFYSSVCFPAEGEAA